MPDREKTCPIPQVSRGGRPCGRPLHSKDACRVHTEDPGREIRPYARGEAGTSYAGIPVATRTAQRLTDAQRKVGLSARQVAGRVMDAWADARVWNARRAAKVGAVATACVLFAASLGVQCAPVRTLVTPPPVDLLPPEPFSDQARPPCKQKSARVINGGCWVGVYDPTTGRQMVECEDFPGVYMDRATRLCWLPVGRGKAAPVPNAAVP